MPFTTAAVIGGTKLSAVAASKMFADAVLMTVAGTGMQMYGAREQAKADEARFEYSQKVATEEARQQKVVAGAEQDIEREKARKRISRMRVLYGKAGVQPVGSPMETILQEAEDSAYDIAMIGYNRGVMASRYRSQAGLYGRQAVSARQTGRIGVGTALVGGMSNLARMSLNYRLNA